MKRLSRRDFGKSVAAAAAAMPLARLPQSSAVAPQQTPAPEAPKPPGMNLPLTPALQQRLQQVLERDARRRAAMRPSALPYDLEPAFVFTVRRPKRGSRAK